MTVYQTSQSENEAFFAEIMPAFLDYVKKHSATVEGVELATSLAGISSMPCLMELGGVSKIVRVPLSMMTANVDEAEQKALAAAQSAETAAGSANSAAQNANDKAALVTEKILDITAEKAKAIEAATNANDKAALAKSIYDTVKAWYESVSPAWSAWFSGVDSDWDAWFEATKTAWDTWFGKVKSDYVAWFNDADAAEKARAAAELVRVDQEKVRVSQEAGREAAETIREQEREEFNTHPLIRGENRNWWRWDMAKHEYVDTGVLADGGIMYPVFVIEDDGGLYMYYTSNVELYRFEYDEEDGGLYFYPQMKENN